MVRNKNRYSFWLIITQIDQLYKALNWKVEKLLSNAVLSNTAPFITFTKLLDTETKEKLYNDFIAAIHSINYISSRCKKKCHNQWISKFPICPYTDEIKYRSDPFRDFSFTDWRFLSDWATWVVGALQLNWLSFH